MKKDVIIIGAGASGLICASEAGKRNRTTLIIDHASKIAGKVRISGGGRSNFTNLNISDEHYISENRHFCRSALSRFGPDKFISLLRGHKISFHEKEDGQLFCDNSSSDIINMLETCCKKAGSEYLLNCSVKSISKNREFRIETDKGIFETDSLVIATGGLSYPELGASNLGFKIADQFKINIVQPKPGLVPLLFSKSDREIFGSLSGLSLNAEVKCNNISFRGKILITHRGLSGPAILQISSYWSKNDALSIDLFPDIDIYEFLYSNRTSRKEIQNFLSQFLPSRFIHTWCSRYIKTAPICQFNEKELKDSAMKLSAWQIKPAGSEGYGSAEVTVGGVDTDEVSSKTMESKKVPGLFFIGEVLDVTGHLGGYNLQWAWSSGHAAGQYA